jgi:hypothetical protein
MILNGIEITSLEHLRSLIKGFSDEVQTSLIRDYLGNEQAPSMSLALMKAEKMLAFNQKIKRDLIAENIVLGITAINGGRDKADLAYGPVFNELDKCKYPEALRELVILKNTPVKHFGKIVTPERIQKYYDIIVQFLNTL